jgi:hypothetical protein
MIIWSKLNLISYKVKISLCLSLSMKKIYEYLPFLGIKNYIWLLIEKTWILQIFPNVWKKIERIIYKFNLKKDTYNQWCIRSLLSARPLENQNARRQTLERWASLPIIIIKLRLIYFHVMNGLIMTNYNM